MADFKGVKRPEVFQQTELLISRVYLNEFSLHISFLPGLDYMEKHIPLQKVISRLVLVWVTNHKKLRIRNPNEVGIFNPTHGIRCKITNFPLYYVNNLSFYLCPTDLRTVKELLYCKHLAMEIT